MSAIYPCTIIRDRYGGAYSKAEWTAWNLDYDRIPEQIDCDDVSCANFWDSYIGLVGKGDTPNEAYLDLERKFNMIKNAEKNL